MHPVTDAPWLPPYTIADRKEATVDIPDNQDSSSPG